MDKVRWQQISEAMQEADSGTPLKDYFDPEELACELFDYAKALADFACMLHDHTADAAYSANAARSILQQTMLAQRPFLPAKEPSDG